MVNEVTTIANLVKPASRAAGGGLSNSDSRSSATILPIEGKSLPRAEKEIEPRREELEIVVQEINEFAKQSNRNLEFSVDDTSGRIIVTVRESDSGEVIRQTPSEEMLAISNLFREATQTNTTRPGLLLADEG